MENYQRHMMGQQSVLKELKNMGIDRSFIVQSSVPESKEAHSTEFISKEELRKEILELRKLFDTKLQNMYFEVVEAKKKSEENADMKKELSELRLELQKISKDQSLMQDQVSRGLSQPAYAPIMPGTYSSQPQQQYYQQPQQVMQQPQQMQQQPQQMRYAQPQQQAHPSEGEHPYQAYLAAQAPPKPVATKPIDRNNIAPSEVQLDKYFNFANKRNFKL